MEIGGTDVVIQTRFDPEQTLVEAIKAIESVWGTSIVEVDNPTEVFVYRTKAAVEAWDTEGWTEQYAKDMVYLISRSQGKMTVVLENDDKDPTLIRIIGAITEALKP
jgi:hypothetical protein